MSTKFFFFLTHHFSIQNGKYLFCFSFCVRGVVFCAPMRMVGFGFYLGKKGEGGALAVCDPRFDFSFSFFETETEDPDMDSEDFSSTE